MSAQTIAAVLFYLAMPTSQPVQMGTYPDWSDCPVAIASISDTKIRAKLLCILGPNFSMMERRGQRRDEESFTKFDTDPQIKIGDDLVKCFNADRPQSSK